MNTETTYNKTFERWRNCQSRQHKAETNIDIPSVIGTKNSSMNRGSENIKRSGY